MHPAVNQSLLVPRPSRLGRFVAVSLVGHGLVLLAVALYAAFIAGPPVDLDAEAHPRLAGAPGQAARREAAAAQGGAAAAAQEGGGRPRAAHARRARARQGGRAHPRGEAGARPQAHAPEGREPRARTGRSASSAPSTSSPSPSPRSWRARRTATRTATPPPPRASATSACSPRRCTATTTSPTPSPTPSACTSRPRWPCASAAPARCSTPASPRPAATTLFDSAVLAAVKKASPFSPPPDHLRDALQKSGIVLEFSP